MPLGEPLQGALFPILEIYTMHDAMTIMLYLHIVIAALIIFQMLRGELRGADLKAVIEVVNALFAGDGTPPTPPDQPAQ